MADQESSSAEVDMESFPAECKNSRSHHKFIPISQFGLEHLPEKHRSQELVNYVKYWANFTVKVSVDYVSKERPDNYPDSHRPYSFVESRGRSDFIRSSTGIIDVSRTRNVKDTCVCPVCKESETPMKEYWTFVVHCSTNAIFDDTEAVCARFQCFYDTKSDLENNRVKSLYGLKLCPTLYKKYRFYSERCQLLCLTHDKDLVDELIHLLVNAPKMKWLYNTNIGIIISHPHGKSKHVTVGTILELRVAIHKALKVDGPTEFGDGAMCKLPETWPELRQLEGNSEFELQTGVKPLPPDMTFQLHDSVKFSHIFKPLDLPWFKFPSKTRFFLANGKGFKFPRETKFSVDQLWPFLYIIYDMTTCKGCTGSPVHMDWAGSPFGSFRHFGQRRDGTNRSGYQYLVS